LPTLSAALLALAACSNNSPATTTTSAPSPAADVSDAGIKWGPAPPVFPAGAEFAVLKGDPSKAEPFVVRLRFPDGYKIAPHTHPTAENVRVVSGTFLAGMGEHFVETQMKAFAVGDSASIPPNHAHYAMARGQTVVEIHSFGPFVLTYVNPADSPVSR
jgi:quercetin dioxygenase-like cupin family protein